MQTSMLGLAAGVGGPPAAHPYLWLGQVICNRFMPPILNYFFCPASGQNGGLKTLELTGCCPGIGHNFPRVISS